MITNSGIVVDPGLDSAPSCRDIAIAMCRITRYAGALWCPLSVHSILVGELVFQSAGEHLGWAYGLLHDAHETVTGEVVRAWKPKEMKGNEQELDRRIFKRLGMSGHGIEQVLASVKVADEKALCLEARIMGLPGWEAYYRRVNGRPPVEPSAWDISFAKKLFTSDWMLPSAISLESKQIQNLTDALQNVLEQNFPTARRILSGPIIDRTLVDVTV